MSATEVSTVPAPSPLTLNLRGAWLDAKMAASGWRIWTTLAWNDITQRYRRSMLGPFWLTLSTAIFVAALGGLYAGLMHMEVKNYLPFIAVGYVLWGLQSSFLGDAGNCFPAAEGFLKQVNISKIGVVLRMILRNFIIFLHNAVVIVAVMVIFQLAPGPYVWLIIPSLLLNLWFGLAVALPLGMICTRFRDLSQMVASLISVLFFLTPIFWNPATASKGLVTVSEINPFSSFIAIFRDPLLGYPIHAHDWIVALLCSLGMSIFAAMFFVRFRSRIMYWV
jgi:ABC-type polysaccharide/polyol phosphate export permease